jgi:carbon storage regulator
MLVLSRKTGERIQIGGGIELEVLAVQGSRVKLGITCPREIPVVRAELSERLPADAIQRHLATIGRVPAVAFAG